MDVDREGKGDLPSPIKQLIVYFWVQKAFSGEEWSGAQNLAQKSKCSESLKT